MSRLITILLAGATLALVSCASPKKEECATCDSHAKKSDCCSSGAAAKSDCCDSKTKKK